VVVKSVSSATKRTAEGMGLSPTWENEEALLDLPMASLAHADRNQSHSLNGVMVFLYVNSGLSLEIWVYICSIVISLPIDYCIRKP